MLPFTAEDVAVGYEQNGGSITPLCGKWMIPSYGPEEIEIDCLCPISMIIKLRHPDRFEEFSQTFSSNCAFFVAEIFGCLTREVCSFVEGFDNVRIQKHDTFKFVRSVESLALGIETRELLYARGIMSCETADIVWNKKMVELIRKEALTADP